ncbi:MAG: WD40 repeat domain-containing protein [Planctomycetes bacterium]|nr:WD40 repeat domain-containing protein [Planctomycetota bacterium]
MKTIPLVLFLASLSCAQAPRAPLAPAEVAKLPETNSRVGSLEFSRDGKSLLCSIEDKHGVAEIHVFDVTSRKRRFVAGMPADGYVYRSGLSADGSTLVTIAGNRLTAWDAASGKERFSKDAEVFAFSADGKTLLVGNWHDRWIALCDPATGAERRRVETLVGVINAMALEDGNLVSLAENGGQGQIQTWDSETGKEISHKEGMACEFMKMVKGAKGEPLAWGFARNSIQLWDLGSLKPLRSWPARGTAFAWAPAGDRLAIAEDGAVVIFDAGSDTPVEFSGTRKPQAPEPKPGVDPDGDKPGRRAAVIPDVTDLAFSPDGRFLAVAKSDATVSVWDLATKSLEAQLATSGKPESARYCHVAWSPDGTKVATSADSAGIVIWDRDAAFAAWKK